MSVLSNSASLRVALDDWLSIYIYIYIMTLRFVAKLYNMSS